MGKGGAAVPNAPDLSGNVSAANKISGTATDEANQTFNTAKAYNANAQTNLTNVTGSQTPVMQNLANTTNQNLNTYGSTFAPLQAKQAQDAANYGNSDNVAKLQGMAMTDQATALNAAKSNSAQALASEGVDPASVHGAALDRQMDVAGAASVAGAGTQSALNTENTGRQLVSGANQLGLQVGALGNSTAATGAGVASGLTGDVNSTNATGISNMTADTGQLNTGVSANKSSSDIASQGFQNSMASYNANQAAASSTLGSVGQIAGMAAMFMDTGGAIPSPGGTGTLVPGSVMGIDRGMDMSRGGVVDSAGALPWAPNPGHPTDTRPIMATPGEYMIPKDVALHKGHEFFHKMIDKSRIDMKNRQAIPHAPSVGV